jgi:hypothetical protein
MHPSGSQKTLDLVPFVTATLLFGIVLVLVHRLALPELPEHLFQILAVFGLYRYFWIRVRSTSQS